MKQENIKAIMNCVRCGYCQAYCPIYKVTKNESMNARGRMQLAKEALKNEFSELFAKRMNQCLLCGSCLEHCPPEVDVPEIIEELRYEILEKNGLSDIAKYMKANAGVIGNITGDEQANRLLWLQPIAEKVHPKMNEKAEYLYLTGCVPSLYPSSYSIPQSFVQILEKAGADYTLMGEKERCCGYPLAIGGLKKEAAEAAERNVQAVKELGVKAVVTTCPSCYHAWKEYYPEQLGYDHGIRVMHSTGLLLELVKQGKLKLSGITDTVTYHDPCDLGRKSGIYDAPRELIKATGAALAEMPRSRENSMCCGGGGNLETNDAALSGKVAQERVKQAMETGAGTIVSGCQQCKRTLQGGARALKARVKVMDICELILNACK
jgi:heterodisulfide reductase subunit D